MIAAIFMGGVPFVTSVSRTGHLARKVWMVTIRMNPGMLLKKTKEER